MIPTECWINFFVGRFGISTEPHSTERSAALEAVFESVNVKYRNTVHLLPDMTWESVDLTEIGHEIEREEEREARYDAAHNRTLLYPGV